MLNSYSIESLVVPAMLVTIDASSLNRQFIIEDLPELGLPINAYDLL